MALYKVALLLGVAGVAYAQFGGDFHHDDHHAGYKFEYSVHDPHTHDVKSQAESRHGDVVKGFYSLKEADGTLREVHYTADGKNGFHADVHRSGHASHPAHYGSSAEGFYGQGGSYGSHGRAFHHGGHGHAFSTNNNNLFSHHY